MFSNATTTSQKMKFSNKDFFSKCDQIRIMENLIFYAVDWEMFQKQSFRNPLKNSLKSICKE